MIRSATEDDIPRLLEMARDFVGKAWTRIGVPYCEASCTEVLRNLLANGILLIADDSRGMIGVVVHPWHFNRSVTTATELFWYCEDGCKAGSALREEAESMARAMGAESINMA